MNLNFFSADFHKGSFIYDIQTEGGVYVEGVLKFVTYL